jgi:hypothetical protein
MAPAVVAGRVPAARYRWVPEVVGGMAAFVVNVVIL